MKRLQIPSLKTSNSFLSWVLISFHFIHSFIDVRQSKWMCNTLTYCWLYCTFGHSISLHLSFRFISVLAALIKLFRNEWPKWNHQLTFDTAISSVDGLHSIFHAPIHVHVKDIPLILFSLLLFRRWNVEKETRGSIGSGVRRKVNNFTWPSAASTLTDTHGRVIQSFFIAHRSLV